MIQTVTYLKDCDHIPITSDNFPADLIAAGRAAQIARGLRFNNRTGVTSTNDGWISRYSNPSDFLPYVEIEPLVHDAFRCEVLNSASRLSRGYSAT